jgi:hypothetical protein
VANKHGAGGKTHDPSILEADNVHPQRLAVHLEVLNIRRVICKATRRATVGLLMAAEKSQFP